MNHDCYIQPIVKDPKKQTVVRMVNAEAGETEDSDSEAEGTSRPPLLLSFALRIQDAM